MNAIILHFGLHKTSQTLAILASPPLFSLLHSCKLSSLDLLPKGPFSSNWSLEFGSAHNKAYRRLSLFYIPQDLAFFSSRENVEENCVR